MNKKALLALCIAVLIPLTGYFVMKYASTDAVIIPRHYLLDSTVTKVENGKTYTDSIWHTVENIKLVNQLGDSVSLYDVPGKALVVDFFFTSCRSICPALTRNMAKLQRSFNKGGESRNKIDTSVVQFVSFTIDPERDSVAKLKHYADRFGVNHDNWWMLTGPKQAIYSFAFDQLKVDRFSDTPIDSDFVHTNRYVLIDRDHLVRGYYNGLDSASITKLARDIGVLMLEKDTMRPAKLPFDPVLMGVFLVITVVIVVIVLSLLSKKNKAQA